MCTRLSVCLLSYSLPIYSSHSEFSYNPRSPNVKPRFQSWGEFLEYAKKKNCSTKGNPQTVQCWLWNMAMLIIKGNPQTVQCWLWNMAMLIMKGNPQTVQCWLWIMAMLIIKGNPQTVQCWLWIMAMLIMKGNPQTVQCWFWNMAMLIMKDNPQTVQCWLWNMVTYSSASILYSLIFFSFPVTMIH